MKPRSPEFSTLSKTLVKLLKLLWIALVFTAVGFYIFRNFDVLSKELSAIPLNNLLLSLGFLIIGRAFMAEISRQTVIFVGWHIQYMRMLYFYAMSQLARYLPGGIWHFVGLAGFYNSEDIPLKTASKAIILEYAWLAISASFVGVTLCTIYFLQTNIVFILGMITLWAVALWVLHIIFQINIQINSILSQMLLQTCVWILIGISFWLIIPEHNTWQLLFLDIGAFSISWVVGFVAVFAPGGIGVREGTLAVILGSVIDTETILVYAAIHRLLYIAADLSLFLIYHAEGTLKNIISEP